MRIQEGGQDVKGPELCRLAPLETPRALQDIKTDLVQLFLTNMASDEVRLPCLATTPHACFASFSIAYSQY